MTTMIMGAGRGGGGGYIFKKKVKVLASDRRGLLFFLCTALSLCRRSTNRGRRGRAAAERQTNVDEQLISPELQMSSGGRRETLERVVSFLISFFSLKNHLFLSRALFLVSQASDPLVTFQ